jgi:predicted nucleotidyltransferase
VCGFRSREDLIIYKANAWRPQDQQDVERLLALHARAIDVDRVRRHVTELSEALEFDRIQVLEAPIRRILPRSSPGRRR